MAETVPAAQIGSPAAGLTANEEWYAALARTWAARIRAGDEAGVHHDPGPDVDFAVETLGLRPGMRVLDLAASWGRTSIELARRGFTVLAYDISTELIEIGRERAAAAGVELEFVSGTVRVLPDLGAFDAVCAFYDDSLFSFADEADNLAALRGVARALRPGGRLLFGTTDCPPELPPFQRAMTRFAPLEGMTLEETITFDAATRTGTSVRRHTQADGAFREYRRRRRHYLPEEAAELLQRAGLRMTGAWCAYDRSLPYGAREEGMVIAATRTP